MVALVFGVISLLACVFLAYVFAQFHRELTRRPGKQIPRLAQTGSLTRFAKGFRYHQQVEFP